MRSPAAANVSDSANAGKEQKYPPFFRSLSQLAASALERCRAGSQESTNPSPSSKRGEQNATTFGHHDRIRIHGRSAPPADTERSYYIGEVKLSNESGQPIGSQAMLAERTYDPGLESLDQRQSRRRAVRRHGQRLSDDLDRQRRLVHDRRPEEIRRRIGHPIGRLGTGPISREHTRPRTAPKSTTRTLSRTPKSESLVKRSQDRTARSSCSWT